MKEKIIKVYWNSCKLIVTTSEMNTLVCKKKCTHVQKNASPVLGYSKQVLNNKIIS